MKLERCDMSADDTRGRLSRAFQGHDGANQDDIYQLNERTEMLRREKQESDDIAHRERQRNVGLQE